MTQRLTSYLYSLSLVDGQDVAREGGMTYRMVRGNLYRDTIAGQFNAKQESLLKTAGGCIVGIPPTGPRCVVIYRTEEELDNAWRGILDTTDEKSGIDA